MEIIINTFGTSIHCEQNCFVIKNKDGTQKIPAEGVHSIQLGKGIFISSDAILLAIENEIDVVFTKRSGEPLGRVWSPKFGSISTIRKGQINFAQSKDATEWVKGIIVKKIENQQAMISMIPTKDFAQTNQVKKAIARLDEYADKVRKIEGESVTEFAQQLRGWEGVSSKIYFEVISLLVDDKYKFAKRSQRPAYDIFNALLNYGYGILYGKIEGALIKSGIDPYIGIFHRDEYNRPVLVYDMIEIFRIWIDYVVWNIISQDIMTQEFYSVRSDGSYWLENLGRRVIIQAVNDYLEEQVKIKGMDRSRSTHILLYAQDLAQLFKKYQNV